MKSGRSPKPAKLEDIFGKGQFLSRDPGPRDRRTPKRSQRSSDLSKRCDIPLVAANDCHYLNRKTRVAHGVLALHRRRTNARSFESRALATDEYLRKSADEMWEIFGAELPEVSSTIHAESPRCAMSRFRWATAICNCPTIRSRRTQAARRRTNILKRSCAEGFEERKQEVWDPLLERRPTKVFARRLSRTRLKDEIEMIKKMGFPAIS